MARLPMPVRVFCKIPRNMAPYVNARYTADRIEMSGGAGENFAGGLRCTRIGAQDLGRVETTRRILGQTFNRCQTLKKEERLAEIPRIVASSLTRVLTTRHKPAIVEARTKMVPSKGEILAITIAIAKI